MRYIVGLVVFLLGLAAGSPALAWGDSGHRTVCEIALRNLTPAARSEVSKLLRAHPAILGANPLNAEYGWACTYPDHPAAGGPGRRSPEHFVNYGRNVLAVSAATGCGGAPLCVISAIAADYAILRSTSVADPERAAALVYIGHWLGDIHQPLHSSFRDDQGGNEMGSGGLCTYSLHSTWDTCILQSRVLSGARTVEEVRQLAAAWSEQVTDGERAQWLSSGPWQWSAESYAVTIAPRTGYCVMVQGACQYSATQPEFTSGQPRRSVTVDVGYMDYAMPIIQRRITQAGVRLAHLLNLALDPAYRAQAS
jgi:S1/P1 Nuclease